MARADYTERMKTPDFPSINGIRFAHIPNHLGYAASDDGRFWSCRYNRWGLMNTWRELKPTPNNEYGRCIIRLGRKRVAYAHHVMLEAFVGPKPANMEALHINGNAGDNRLANLRWGSREENIADMRLHGRMKGEKHFAAKLTADLVREIRRRADAGEIHQQIANSLGIKREQVSKIYRRERWAHIT